MPAPWEADEPLDPQRARAVVAAALPALAVRDIAPLGDGWDFTTFRADSAVAAHPWVVRFAKRHDNSRRFMEEVRVLAGLTSALDRSDPAATIDVPRYRYALPRTNEYPFALGVYPLLAGHSVDPVPPAQLDAAAIGAQLGGWLRRVHASTPVTAPARVPEHFAADLVDFRATLHALRPHLDSDLAGALSRLLAAPYEPVPGPPCFCHADLGMEHVLVEPASGCVVGVIDWTDARWDHPLQDFAGLWAWGGDAAAAAALAAYGQPLSAAAWAALRRRGACAALGQAHYGYFAGRETERRLGMARLARMHRAGQLDDCRAPDA